jgi:hypothetical protein
MINLRTQLSLLDPLDAAVFACLTTTFFATARTSEFTVNNLSTFDPLRHVTRGHMSIQRDRLGLEITNFRLPHTKAAPQGEDVNWAKQDGLADPQRALQNHFTINNPPQQPSPFCVQSQEWIPPFNSIQVSQDSRESRKSCQHSPLEGTWYTDWLNVGISSVQYPFRCRQSEGSLGK